MFSCLSLQLPEGASDQPQNPSPSHLSAKLQPQHSRTASASETSGSSEADASACESTSCHTQQHGDNGVDSAADTAQPPSSCSCAVGGAADASSCPCCTAPRDDVSYIPIFGSLADVLRQRQLLQHNKTQQQHNAGGGSTAAEAAALCAGFQQLQVDDAFITQQQQHADQHAQHSLQLAWEQSSSADWHPQPLDTLVAVVGAPPSWMCSSDQLLGQQQAHPHHTRACSGGGG